MSYTECDGGDNIHLTSWRSDLRKGVSTELSKGAGVDLQTLTYIISTYRTFTAGAREDRETVPKPAARTAVAWSKPMMNRTPMGMELIAGLPMSSTRKKNQSVALSAVG